MKKRVKKFAVLFGILLMLLGGCVVQTPSGNIFLPVDDDGVAPDTGTYSEDYSVPTEIVPGTPVKPEEIPVYKKSAYVKINDNIPNFTEEEKIPVSFELYGELDKLNRCTVVYACIGKDLMPTEEREPIGSVKPTGWHLIKYDCIEDLYLYNRCHLIGYQLSGENANTQNLVTGTRYMNVKGMLPFENKVAEYVKKTGNHVLYRVTPIFEGDNLLCLGVQMEAWSVEDNGKGVCFHVFCYNVQPGIGIDYETGESWEIVELEMEGNTGETSGEAGSNTEQDAVKCRYILNTNTGKFHYSDCSSVTKMKESNKKEFTGSRQEAIENGYEPCGNCKP